MQTLDVKNIRKNFTIFSLPEHQDWVYLDSAATTQRPEQVLTAVETFYQRHNANAHRSSYKLAGKATQEYEAARERVRAFINAPAVEQIIFTRNTTESLNLIAIGWAMEVLKPGDEIILTELEHHSNLVPWQMVCKRVGAILKYVEFDREGKLDLNQFHDLLGNKTKLLTVGHVSNALGTINPIKEMIDAAHKVGAVTVIDAAQSAPHLRLDVEKLDADFIAFSGHKMLAPLGIGVLYGRKSLLDRMEPMLFGGSMIGQVDYFNTTWNELPWKFEAGTQNTAGAVGLAAAIDYLEKIGLSAIELHDRELTAYAWQQLTALNGVTVYGPATEHGPAISFNLDGIHSHDLSTFLDQEGIAVRSGHHCAQLVMKKLNIAATARASFYLYNDKKDIDRLVVSLQKAKDYFKKWL